DGAKCSVCGKVTKEQKEISALGHSFKDGVCTVCGAIDSNYKLMLNSDSKLILSEEKAMIFGIPESTGGMTAGDFKSQISNKINIGIDDSAIITNGLKFSFGNTEYSIILKGDVNADGKISAADARTILRIAAKLENPDEVTKESADIDSDGKVTSKEARSVLRFTAKLQKKIYE
ncbi:MAG: dockerin type I repeat-containing protein, partial [Oscillospiraceae bacterium]|nr:dockerin type I repeat-containing protein [Oscillospiraceae bacterium]